MNVPVPLPVPGDLGLALLALVFSRVVPQKIQPLPRAVHPNLKCCNPEKDARFTSMAALAQALRALTDRDGSLAKASTRWRVAMGRVIPCLKRSVEKTGQREEMRKRYQETRSGTGTGTGTRTGKSAGQAPDIP